MDEVKPCTSETRNEICGITHRVVPVLGKTEYYIVIFTLQASPPCTLIRPTRLQFQRGELGFYE